MNPSEPIDESTLILNEGIFISHSPDLITRMFRSSFVSMSSEYSAGCPGLMNSRSEFLNPHALHLIEKTAIGPAKGSSISYSVKVAFFFGADRALLIFDN